MNMGMHVFTAEESGGALFRAEALRGDTPRLLAQHLDLRPAADATSLAAIEVLERLGAFRVVGDVSAEPGEAGLSELSAVLPFRGDLQGHLLLSTTSVDARELYQRFIPDSDRASLDQSEDLVGELCNQIVGRIAARLSRHALHVNHTTPSILRSAERAPRYRGRQLSVGIQLSDGRLRVFVELCLQGFDDATLTFAAPTESTPHHDIHFF